MSDDLDYDAFYALVSDAVTQGTTCTVFGRTDSKHSVILSVDRGDIVCLRCGTKTGHDAIAALRQMQRGSFRVDDTPLKLHSGAPPPTAEIIAALHPATAVSDDDVGDTRSTQRVEPTREAVLLCDLLSRYVGPVAPLLCSEQIGAVGGLEHRGHLELVLGRLALEIEDAAEADEFVSAAHRALGASLPPQPRPPSQAATSPEDATPFDAGDAEAVLGQLLADYLGPVAPVICEEQITAAGGLHSHRQLAAVISGLAYEIAERDESERFLAQAREAFGPVLD
ncbi:MAG: hypothetical protein QNJ91_17075 [Gammaproteobacteria bacterium]|nr:hypothetical protein [Gammaproteobacteria bacterium]